MKKTALPPGELMSVPLNTVIEEISIRPNRTTRIRQNFDACPSMAEQHTAHLSDINHLVEKYKPDELAAYLAAKAQYKQEIVGHDFSQEPDLQQARNEVYRLKENFKSLPEEVQANFRSHVEFMKFIDNPANAEKMLKLGILTKRQIQENTTTPPATTQEAATKE